MHTFKPVVPVWAVVEVSGFELLTMLSNITLNKYCHASQCQKQIMYFVLVLLFVCNPKRNCLLCDSALARLWTKSICFTLGQIDAPCHPRWST